MMVHENGAVGWGTLSEINIIKIQNNSPFILSFLSRVSFCFIVSSIWDVFSLVWLYEIQSTWGCIEKKMYL